MKESTPSADPVDTDSSPVDRTLNADLDRPKVKAGWIWLLIIAMLGTFMALVGAMSVGLSLRVQQIAPENVEVLGYVVGAGAIVSALAAPLIGMWSDRTRTRWGRRRPFAFVGVFVGLIALALFLALLGLGRLFAFSARLFATLPVSP